MIRSMTAFASGERESEGWVFAWEIRTVNHRFLDVSLRLPEVFRFLESDTRACVGQFLKRGRVDCTLSWKKAEQDKADIQLNIPLVENLLTAAREVEQLGAGQLAPFDAIQILQWPGALHQPETDREALANHALSCLSETLEKLVTSRETEGGQLALLIEERCQGIQMQVSKVRQRLPEVLQAIRAKITTRLGELSANFDQDRLEQEMVYLAQKLDVSEELDRLETHLAEVARSLRQREPVGRRLDFLLQELNREANTLGSKSADAETTRASVEIKVLIEQMREQVQNVE